MIHADAVGNTFLIVEERLPLKDRSAWILAHHVQEDGVIWVDEDASGFFMDYYNRDGSRASLCGNGSRSVICYLLHQGRIKACEWVELHTNAGTLLGMAISMGEAMVSMPLVEYISSVKCLGYSGHLLKVGVPHAVFEVSRSDMESAPLEACFKSLSTHPTLPQGANINFFSVEDDKVYNRTFERGVSAETLSCGTGSVAVVWVLHSQSQEQSKNYMIQTQGGILEVLVNDRQFFLKGKVELHELV